MEKLSVAERACVLRAIRKQRDELAYERERLIALDGSMSREQQQRFHDIESELHCLSRSADLLWRTM